MVAILSQPKAEIPFTTDNLRWATGFLEGEGSFGVYRYSRKDRPSQKTYYNVTAGQKELEPLLRLKQIFGGAISRRNRNRDFYYTWRVTGPRGRGVAMTLYSLMCERRKTQIRKMLERA